MPNKTSLLIDGNKLNISNLNKVLYPAIGMTKSTVLDYYIRIAPYLLPHLANKPLTLKRYPNGIDGKSFYQKQCPVHRPNWLNTAPIWSKHNQHTIHYCLVNNLASLVWISNLAALELHTSLSVAGHSDTPNVLVFDLDPGPPADILTCARVSLLLKKHLDTFNLRSYPKTSGSKGLQLYIPLHTRCSYNHTKNFSHSLAQTLEKNYPDLIVSKMTKKLRTGKVLIDWSQNDSRKTTISVYSLRATPQATVSTPVIWDEISKALEKNDSSILHFNYLQVLERTKEYGDLFKDVLSLKQKIT